MIIRPILISALSRHKGPHLNYVPNVVKQRPQRLTPVTFGVAAGLALSLAVGLVHLDSDTFRTKETTVVDPATFIEFPTTLRIPFKGLLPEFTLIGVGVRTVSFLRIKVYSAAFYADLTNPNLKIPSSASPEEKIQYIVRNTACVLRIIPTRNTTYSHLRDGFVRALEKRQWITQQAGELSSDEQLKLQAPIGQLRSAFPNTPMVKGTPLDLVLAPPDSKQPRALIIRDLGAIQNGWVAQELFLSFFDRQGNSPALKQSVLDRVAQL